jgi:hypothetical protein
MVKLDSSIVTSLSGAAAFDTVSEVVQACASRGITVVAKGIEQPSTVDVLTSLGVTLGQGYLLSQPHAAVTLANVLETIREFGEANLPLIAWEFTVPERVVESAWSHVLAEGLIETSGIDEDTGEGMYRLTHRGELRVDELRDGGGSDH